MLTGKRAFDGEDVSDTLATVLKGEPDWNALPSDVPDRIVALIKRCLTKDPKSRVAYVAAPLYVLSESGSAQSGTQSPRGIDESGFIGRSAAQATPDADIARGLGPEVEDLPGADLVATSIVASDGGFSSIRTASRSFLSNMN